MAVVPFARLSRRARVVDGEDSEKGVEQKAAHGKPLQFKRENRMNIVINDKHELHPV